MNQKIYQFEGFVLDQKKRQLFFAGKPVVLTTKAFEILSNLIASSGDIVSKDELLSKVWDDSFVEESNLPVHISALRKVFKEYGMKTDFIKTVSGRGYIFTVQTQEISEKQDNLKLNPASQTNNSEVSDLYIKGKYIIETVSTRTKIESDLYQAIEFFNSAIKLDSNFAKAYIGIGFATYYLNNFGYLPKKEAYTNCRIMLQQAKSINDRLSEVYCLEGIINVFFELDIPKAKKPLLKAVELDPNNARAFHWLGISEMFLGNTKEAYFYFNEAAKLNPSNIAYHNGLIRVHYFAGDFNKTILKAKEVLALDSRSFAALFLLAKSYAQLGIYDEALKFINETLLILDNLECRSTKACILIEMNQPEEAEKLICEILSDKENLADDLNSIIWIYAAQFKADEAFELLFDYYDKTGFSILSIKVDPLMKNLRKDERFQILLEKLNLL